ncbi:hypothetical protein [Ideonella paludis]|uniref:Uncharacterized protein n=1 Tax=Ideonella paludis TaxID=1233411 RepID=A0ABS5DU13_9BURK|nr:hypothetical protein [Ideonella paludis]MBQ0934627.1 hypothetical protein [Ideonella paludis]
MSMSTAMTLGLHLFTAHVGGDAAAEHLQPVNPGIYFRAESGATVGAYRNSYGRASAYAGMTWQTSDGRFALTVGGVTGYPAAKVLPVVSPSVRLPLGDDGYALRVAYLPKAPCVGTAHGLHIALERRF